MDNKEESNAAENDSTEQGKSKSQLRAERRALQEAQRAAKAAKKSEGGGAAGNQPKQQQSAGKGDKGGKKPEGAAKPASAGNKAHAQGDGEKGKQHHQQQQVGKVEGHKKSETDSQSKQQQSKSQGQQIHKSASDASNPSGQKLPTRSPQVSVSYAPDQSSKATEPRVPDYVKLDDEKTVKRMKKRLEKQQVPQRASVQRKANLFNHLPQYDRALSVTKAIPLQGSPFHPAIIKLGVRLAEMSIVGSHDRCMALLDVLKEIISSYETPPDKDMARDLYARIQPCITFLNQCRPLSVSMKTVVRFLKSEINRISPQRAESEAKLDLLNKIDTFRSEVDLAGEAISQKAAEKISDNDVIMVYGCSKLIHRVLRDVHKSGKKISVIVVDGRPRLEGRRMLKWLTGEGIECTYIFSNAVCYMMKEVTKVLLGAHALLANGYVMSRIGSAQVALCAAACNVPVLVCCESYKFSERVQTDSFVFNELGDPNDVSRLGGDTVACLGDWQQRPGLTLLSLMYDVTPPDLITMVITELGMVPCTSVPVVLRVRQVDFERES